MSDSEELSSLERVKERLYDAEAPDAFKEPTLSERPVERARGWNHLEVVRKEAELISGPARFFIVAFIFFFVTAGGALFYLIYGGSSVSTNNVNIAVQGPTTIASGDTVPLLITIENRNPVAIHAAKINITFPEGTKDADDPTKPLTLYSEDLGTIDSGGKVERTVRAAVFGSEGQRVTLPLKIEYHTDGSNAVFIKNKTYEFTITSSPITLNITALSQVSAGQPVNVDVSIRSNASTILQNVAVSAVYPFGFAPTATTPAPSTGNSSLFVIGSLAPGEEKHISIRGVLSGENNDDRVFKFSAGSLATADALTLTNPYTSKEADIKLTKPFLATTLSINRDTSDTPVVDAGVPVQVTVGWTNTLATEVTNAKVAVALSGEGLEPASVVAGSGFYRSSDNTVIFDSSTNPVLAALQPGDTGQGTFTFKSKSSGALASLRNPFVTLRVSVAGSRLSETNVPETISSTLTRTVKVGTSLALASKIVHSTGPFNNTGPVPPEANKETTYAAVLTLSNSGNTVAGATVTAALPSYVRFTGSVSPNDGSVTYNDTTRTVTWSAGDITSGGAGKTVSFQIGFTPSTSQQGSSPILLFAQQVVGVDRFTTRQISGSMPALTTQLTSDPAYPATGGFGTVK
ncbi:MAG: protein of unknown function with transrane region [Parcubacteria group bacterium]|nr:protein of unknown function with transrane region [Parcubacteria group bacterium]